MFVKAYNSAKVGPADYTCDGTDDNVEIQAAIDALTKGGTVELSDGTFRIGDTIRIKGGLTIRGQGQYGTEMVAKQGLNKDMLSYSESTNQYFFQMINLTMSGGNNFTTPNTVGRGLVANNKLNDGYITKCFIRYFPQNAVYLGTGWGWVLDASVIEYNAKYGGRALEIVTGRGARIYNCKIMENYAENIYLWSTYETSIYGCYMRAETNKNGIALIDADRTVIVGNHFAADKAGSTSVYLRYDTDDAVVNGNSFSGAAGAKTAIKIDHGGTQSVDGTTISGNSIHGYTNAIEWAQGNASVDTKVIGNSGTDVTYSSGSPTLDPASVSQLDISLNKITATLPDGDYSGQIATIVLTTQTYPPYGVATVTVPNYGSGIDNSCTMSSTDDMWSLMWNAAAGKWFDVIKKVSSCP